MRLFELFVDNLQVKPEITYGGSIESSTGARATIAAGTDNTWIKNEILEKIEDCNLYVLSLDSIFTPFDVPIKSIENNMPYERLGEIPREIELDVAPPFKTCWFQFEEPGNNELNGFNDRRLDFRVYGMFIHEIAPHEALFCFVMQDKDSRLLRYRYGHGIAMEDRQHDVWHSIAVWLQPFKKGSGAICGSMKTSSRVKFRHPKTGEKVLYKIKKVVMVYPKKMSAQRKAKAESEGVNFSHRWESCGHWRKVKGIGKNREDEYVVSGWTYVRESVKGPKHLPLIKKTRVILADKKDPENPQI